jgi:hypothetical protein
MSSAPGEEEPSGEMVEPEQEPAQTPEAGQAQAMGGGTTASGATSG